MLPDKIEAKTTKEHVPSHNRIRLLLSGNTKKTLRAFLQSITFGLQDKKLTCRPCQQSIFRCKKDPNIKPEDHAALDHASLIPQIIELQNKVQENTAHPPKVTKSKRGGRERKTHQQSTHSSIHRVPKHTKEASTLPINITPKITKLDVGAKKHNGPPPIYKNPKGTQKIAFQTITLDYDKCKQNRLIQPSLQNDAKLLGKGIPQYSPLVPHKTKIHSMPHLQKKPYIEYRNNQQSDYSVIRKDCNNSHQEITKGLQITKLDCPNRQTVRPIHRYDKKIQQTLAQSIALVPDISQLKQSTNRHGVYRAINKPAKGTHQEFPEHISMGLQITEVKYSEDQPPTHRESCNKCSHVTRVDFCPGLNLNNQIHRQTLHTWPVDSQPISMCLQITPL
ncbi:uncharacterized protein LOC144185900 [Stigmatopora nigra]